MMLGISLVWFYKWRELVGTPIYLLFIFVIERFMVIQRISKPELLFTDAAGKR